jgi:hypothetical protein
MESCVDGHVVLKNGLEVDSNTIVWTAGVKPNPALARFGLPLGPRGHVDTDATLQVKGTDYIWAAGDNAQVPDLAARAAGVDLLPDPLGWALVLHGVGRLRDLPGRSSVTAVVAVALGVSAVLWVPGVDGWLADRDDSLLWAASLPQVAAVAVLTASLGGAADDAGDRGAARWLRWARTLTLVAGVLPVLVLATGAASIGVMLLVGLVALGLAIVLTFRYSGRPWAAPRTTAAAHQAGGPDAPPA